MQQPLNESIWADGVPEKVDEKYVMTYKDILTLTTRAFIDKYAIPNGFKIEHANTNPTQFPNVVIKRNDKIYSIVILPFYGNMYGFIKPEVRIPFVKFTKEKGATPILVPFLVSSIDKERTAKGIALKGDLFNVTLHGFIELTEDEHQENKIEDPIAKSIDELENIAEA